MAKDTVFVPGGPAFVFGKRNLAYTAPTRATGEKHSFTHPGEDIAPAEPTIMSAQSIQEKLAGLDPEDQADEINEMIMNHGGSLRLSNSDGDEFTVIDTHIPTSKKPGAKTQVVLIVDPKESAETLHKGMQQCYDATPEGKQVTVMTEEDIQQAQLAAISMDGHAGAVVKANGESGGLYSNSTLRGIGGALLQSRLDIAGDKITHLECFDTYLPKIYAKQGFKPVSAVTFDPKYAPEGWDYEAMSKYNNGKPRVLLMMHESKLPVDYDPENIPETTDYDEAHSIMEQIMKKSQEALGGNE